MASLSRRLDRYRLTTAEILYHLPDWHRSLDGKLHSVTVASTQLISPGEMRYAGTVLTLH